MHPVTLCVTSIEADAERPWRRYHAERGNDQVLFPSSHQLVTERPSVTQNRAHPTKPPTAQNLSAKNFIHARALDSGALQPCIRFFLSTPPASWPLDCICLYVQVKTYAYESLETLRSVH
ncbi:hypothetical protein C0J26_01980 [Pseudomonas baetica]|nr:hypothetical protein C0J26_01980 [Pseudomonas baetica]